MDMLGLAPKHEANTAKKTTKARSAPAQPGAAQRKPRREEVARPQAASNSDDAAGEPSVALQNWTSSYLVDFSLESTLPTAFVEKTTSARNKFASVGDTRKLRDVRSFAGGANAAGLFWALTHASREAHELVRKLRDENTTTLGFVDGLKAELKTAKQLFDADLRVAVGQVHSHVVPALKEASVGADLLLVISGDGLVAGGGVRLAWIQFKLTSAKRSLAFNVHSEKNVSTGTTQFEALQGVHSIEKGSFSLYALGSLGLPFYAAIPVDWIEGANMDDPSTCKVDLGKQGVRFQELMVMLAGNTGAGAFSKIGGGTGFSQAGSFRKAADVVAFVDAAATERSIVPLMVLGVSSGTELVNTQQLVQQIAKVWDRRLAQHLKTLDRADPDSSGPEQQDSTTRSGPRRPGPERGGMSR